MSDKIFDPRPVLIPDQLTSNMEKISSSMGSLAAAVQEAFLALNNSAGRIQYPPINLHGYKSKIFTR